MIFGRCAKVSHLEDLNELTDDYDPEDVSSCTTDDLGSMLKKYLRDLPEGLIPESTFDVLVDTYRQSGMISIVILIV